MINYGFIIICIYLLVGIIYIFLKKELPRIYVAILFFFSLKIGTTIDNPSWLLINYLMLYF